MTMQNSSSKREIRESPVEQGSDESITYSLTTTPWGGSPSNASVKVYEMEYNGALTDVTATVCNGTASIVGDKIILPAIDSLEVGKTYRVEVLWTKGASQLEAWGLIYCTR